MSGSVDLLLELTGPIRSIELRPRRGRVGIGERSAISRFTARCRNRRTRPVIRAQLVGLIENPREHPLVRGGALESVAAFGSDEFVTRAIRAASIQARRASLVGPDRDGPHVRPALARQLMDALRRRGTSTFAAPPRSPAARGENQTRWFTLGTIRATRTQAFARPRSIPRGNRRQRGDHDFATT